MAGAQLLHSRSVRERSWSDWPRLRAAVESCTIILESFVGGSRGLNCAAILRRNGTRRSIDDSAPRLCVKKTNRIHKKMNKALGERTREFSVRGFVRLASGRFSAAGQAILISYGVAFDSFFKCGTTL